MNITPVANKLSSSIQNLGKEKHVIISAFESVPTEKMGGWSMFGADLPLKTDLTNLIASRFNKLVQPVSNTFDKIV